MNTCTTCTHYHRVAVTFRADKLAYRTDVEQHCDLGKVPKRCGQYEARERQRREEEAEDKQK